MTLFPLFTDLLNFDATVGKLVQRRIAQDQRLGQNIRQSFFSTISSKFGLFSPRAETECDLSHVGLILSDIYKDDSYFRYEGCTPPNCLIFAKTGVAGVHFSFLKISNRIDESSPVIVTLPACGVCSYVVGENLHDFLSLGCLRGFLGMSYFYSNDYRPYFNKPEFIPSENDARHGFEVNAEKEAILERLRQQFSLEPWLNVTAHLADLEHRFASLIDDPIEAW